MKDKSPGKASDKDDKDSAGAGGLGGLNLDNIDFDAEIAKITGGAQGLLDDQ